MFNFKFNIHKLDANQTQFINRGTDIPYADFSHNYGSLNNPVTGIGTEAYNAGVAVYNGGVWVVNTVSSWFE